jgi:predicted phosphodiesterase
MENRTFKYSLISDMHIDFPQEKTPYEKLEQNVIVAGDTSNGLEGLKFLQKLRNKGFTVFATEGNHEHYSNVSQGRTLGMTTERFREDFPVITDIDDTLTLVLLNGWYRVSSPFLWYRYQNDCRNMCGKDANAGAKYISDLAVFEADFLNDLLESFHDRKFIVTTHTAPCVETLDPKFYGHDSNEWYWSPYMRQVLALHSDKILVWNHGHTHASNEAVVDGVTVVCNPRGYPGENKGWVPRTVEISY